MLSRPWLHGFIVFDACMLVLVTAIAWLGNAVSVWLVVVAVLAVSLQLWEVFRRRTVRVAPSPRAEPDS